MLAYYGTQISPNQLETEEGFLICKNVPIARTGKQLYRAGDLQLTGDPERGIWVERTEEEVFDLLYENGIVRSIIPFCSVRWRCGRWRQP